MSTLQRHAAQFGTFDGTGKWESMRASVSATIRADDKPHTVTFTTSISRSIDTFPNKGKALAAARAWITDLLTTRAKKAGERFRRIDSNTLSIKDAAGATVATASVKRLDEM